MARKHRIGADAAIGVITTASFALGVALLAKFGSRDPASTTPCSGRSTASPSDQIVMLVAVSVATVRLRRSCGYRALLFTTFDPEVRGLRRQRCPSTHRRMLIAARLAILATLTVIGVTLVAAMLVIPAVVARMLTDSFGRMLVCCPR